MIRLALLSALTLIISVIGMVSSSVSANYSSGTYGSCQYGSCSISLSSDGAVAVDVVPSGGSTRCTIQSDSVTAITGSSTGYTVTINNADTETTLHGPNAETIASVSGTDGSPVALSANIWGYRVDGVASFGVGPTTPLVNTAVPVLTFAATPSSESAGGIVRYTESTDLETTATSVWYGVCVDASTVAGVYTDTVLYTAVINY